MQQDKKSECRLDRPYVSYPFRIKTVDMKAGVGMVPWNADATYYSGTRGFYIRNVFLNPGKSWSTKGVESMQIGLFTHLI